MERHEEGLKSCLHQERGGWSASSQLNDGGSKFAKWKVKTCGCLQCDKSCHLAGKTCDFQESRYKYIDLGNF